MVQIRSALRADALARFAAKRLKRDLESQLFRQDLREIDVITRKIRNVQIFPGGLQLVVAEVVGMTREALVLAHGLSGGPGAAWALEMGDSGHVGVLAKEGRERG